ncbi:PREDICTED: uncharacterized protein LOC108564062 [Nicrophorus vespilloides]|uniref:Uncharacterized protein LOC108564062 n=1 Tax=Nicrophorus vespilloides TaxID=110193 RepID=A0ABM1MV60_NICVS|nr:PREDICTED: uncharacterized protein LOC108564062 [Nicrophorus vespilloides]
MRFTMFCISFLIFPLVFALKHEYSQTGYKFQIHHGIPEDFNPNLVADYTFGYNKYNRSTRAFNLGVRFLKKIDSVTVLMETAKFINNQFREFVPLNLMFNICAAMKSELFGIKTLLKYGNLTTCPFEKGYYVMRNFVVDDSLFLPNIPLGQYKFTLTFSTHEKLLIKYSFVAELKNRKYV